MTEKITPSMSDEQARIIGREIGQAIADAIAREIRSLTHVRLSGSSELGLIARTLGQSIGEAIAKGKG